MEHTNQIVIYNSEDGQAQLDVQFQEETIWLTQKQMALLFEKDSDTIGLHLKNIFKTKELDKKGTTEKYSVVQKEGEREVKRSLLHYNLDAIISVGYRVNSKRGTQFRIWANKILKDYLVKGYAVNEKRLKESQQKFIELKQTIKLLENVVSQKQLDSQEATGLLKVITEYASALDLLDQYDHQKLTITAKADKDVVKLTYQEAIAQIILWRDTHDAGGLFGNQKDKSFQSSLQTVYQTFDGVDLYPSTEEKAANLLYFVVKNHSFSDGNKRIAAGLFVFFLDKNNKLYNNDGSKIIADNALVAITIMIAESNPDEKDTMVKLIVNLMTSM
ncbi:cytochrome C biogenesis protein CycH [Flavobacteriales bacterium 34_180_T64]|nr:cytochrome C biogenesis protein CycH [Flavobacteriales bacterium 34_180_T64]